MTPAERLRDLLENDPRPDHEIGGACVPPMPQATVNRIKRGKMKKPTLNDAGRLLKAMGLDWSDLNVPDEDQD